MPGKVNPVIPEVMNQICYKVMGNELCVTMAGEAAQMELNAMEPVMAQCCFESVDLMVNGFETLRTRCVEGITANAERCKHSTTPGIMIIIGIYNFQSQGLGVPRTFVLADNVFLQRINIGITIIDNRSDTMLHQALYDG